LKLHDEANSERHGSIFKLENEDYMVFYKQTCRLNVTRFDKTGLVKQRYANLLNNESFDSIEIACMGKNYVLTVSLMDRPAFIRFNGSSNLSCYDDLTGHRSDHMILLIDENLNYLSHFNVKFSARCLAASKSRILVVDSGNNLQFFDSSLSPILVQRADLLKISQHTRRYISRVALSDSYLFILGYSADKKLLVFNLETFDFVAEIETTTTAANQLKLLSSDFIFLFNSQSNMASVHKQQGPLFEKVEDLDLSQSLSNFYQSFDLAGDETSFVSFYDSTQVKFNLY
jgi:hypothetical protein